MASRSRPAEWIFLRGSVMTMDGTRPSAPAVAVAGGRIVAVGEDRSIRELVGPRTRRVDLAGRALLPGGSSRTSWSSTATWPRSDRTGSRTRVLLTVVEGAAVFEDDALGA